MRSPDSISGVSSTAPHPHVAELQQQMAESDDFPEGVAAFPQEREADFRGR